MSKGVFPDVLRAIRTEQKLSQEKLAELCSLDPVTIYRYENGIVEPTLTNFFKLSKGLSITVSEFVEKLEAKGYPN